MDRIGIAISTRNRRDTFNKSYAQWRRFLPPGAVLVIVDDASDVPVPQATYRFDQNVGVAQAKNRSIELLYNAGADHIVLADDDIHPITPDWWQPYVQSPMKHLCHCWGRSRYLKEEAGHTYWSWPRGVMLYLQREVIDRVGGMRTEFAHAGEHAEYSRRISNAGLIPHPFIDVAAARHGVWWAADYTREIPSSLPDTRWNDDATAARHQLYHQYRNSTDWVDYRITPDETAAAQ
jgi:GT2 family glycosyltransferase